MTIRMTLKQEKKASFLLQRKEELQSHIATNKRELLNISYLMKKETNLNTRVEMENKETIGQNLVKEQTKELAGLSRLKIADKVGVTYRDIINFDIRAKNNWRKWE